MPQTGSLAEGAASAAAMPPGERAKGSRGGAPLLDDLGQDAEGDLLRQAGAEIQPRRALDPAERRGVRLFGEQALHLGETLGARHHSEIFRTLAQGREHGVLVPQAVRDHHGEDRFARVLERELRGIREHPIRFGEDLGVRRGVHGENLVAHGLAQAHEGARGGREAEDEETRGGQGRAGS